MALTVSAVLETHNAEALLELAMLVERDLLEGKNVRLTFKCVQDAGSLEVHVPCHDLNGDGFLRHGSPR
jgi:hypothetical protein